MQTGGGGNNGTGANGSCLPLSTLKSVIEEIKRDYTFHKEFGNAIIVHTNNPNGAKLMSDMFYEVFGIMPEIRIMGPIIGAHVGPNAVAITFLSNEQRKYSSNK